MSGDCAHIWPEAYIRGVGWVPFEPTSAYRTAEEYTWHRRPAVSGDDSQSAYVPPIPAPTQIPEAPDNKETAGSLSGMTLDQAMQIALPTALSILITLALLILGTLSAARLRYLRAKKASAASPQRTLPTEAFYPIILPGRRKRSGLIFRKYSTLTTGWFTEAVQFPLKKMNLPPVFANSCTRH